MFDGQKYLFYNNNEENVFGFCPQFVIKKHVLEVIPMGRPAS